MKRAQRNASPLPQRPDHGVARRRRVRGAAAIVLVAGLSAGMAACGDDDDDGLDDVDVDLTTDLGSDDTGMAPGTTMDATDLTTGGTASGDSATVTTPVSGSVSNDDGGSGATTAP